MTTLEKLANANPTVDSPTYRRLMSDDNRVPDPLRVERSVRKGVFRVAIKGSLHDWRRLALEGDIQHLRCARCKVRVAVPVQGPPPNFLCLP